MSPVVPTMVAATSIVPKYTTTTAAAAASIVPRSTAATATVAAQEQTALALDLLDTSVMTVVEALAPSVTLSPHLDLQSLLDLL